MMAATDSPAHWRGSSPTLSSGTEQKVGLYYHLGCKHKGVIPASSSNNGFAEYSALSKLSSAHDTTKDLEYDDDE